MAPAVAESWLVVVHCALHQPCYIPSYYLQHSCKTSGTVRPPARAGGNIFLFWALGRDWAVRVGLLILLIYAGGGHSLWSYGGKTPPATQTQSGSPALVICRTSIPSSSPRLDPGPTLCTPTPQPRTLPRRSLERAPLPPTPSPSVLTPPLTYPNGSCSNR